MKHQNPTLIGPRADSHQGVKSSEEGNGVGDPTSHELPQLPGLDVNGGRFINTTENVLPNGYQAGRQRSGSMGAYGIRETGPALSQSFSLPAEAQIRHVNTAGETFSPGPNGNSATWSSPPTNHEQKQIQDLHIRLQRAEADQDAARKEAEDTRTFYSSAVQDTRTQLENEGGVSQQKLKDAQH